MDDQEKVTYFAETDYRNKKTRFGIKSRDRARHAYVIGKTGMGKSTLLENMAIQDIQNGEGLAIMDPHGDFAERMLDYIPEDRVKDVIYFAPFDIEYPVSFNVMESVDADKRHLVASGLMSVFKKIWVDAWSARMEYILNNILLALLEYPNATILGVNRMLADKEYRKQVVDNITDPSIKAFWTDEFAKYGERYMQEAGAAIQNKIGQFVSNPIIRNIVGQPTSSFDVRRAMDERKIIIINLSKGRIGEQNASLLGGMLITKIYLGAMSRADSAQDIRDGLPNFYLYVDEFQSFASDSFADILSEARKYKLNLIIAHQYIEQMSEQVKAAVFGNVGTMIVFRVGSTDAETFEKEFSPHFTAEDIVNLGFAQIYLKLMINGIGSKPFSAVTIPRFEPLPRSYRDEIVEYSRTANAKPRFQVEKDIRDWHGPTLEEKKQKEYEERVAKRALEGGESVPQENPQPQDHANISAKPAHQNNGHKPRPNFTPKGESNHSNNFRAPKPPRQNGERHQAPKPFFPKQNPNHITEPKPEKTSGPSPLLKDLLNTIQSETKKETPFKEIQNPNPVPEPASPISLSSLKSSQDKSAGVDKISALKEALSRALPKEKEDSPKSEEKKEERKEDPIPKVTKNVKEIPEDVLRKILD